MTSIFRLIKIKNNTFFNRARVGSNISESALSFHTIILLDVLL